jgi:Mg2+-importing ATPase
MATQILVVFIIRTATHFWEDRPHPVLTAAALLCLAAALLLPYLPIARLLGFAGPNLAVLGTIFALVILYLAGAEILKQVAIPERGRQQAARASA